MGQRVSQVQWFLRMMLLPLACAVNVSCFTTDSLAENPHSKRGKLITSCLEHSEALGVSSFTLINAETGEPILGHFPLENGAIIDIASLPIRKLTIRAEPASSKVSSIQFVYDDTCHHIENIPPFTLKGDNPATRTYNEWKPTLGTHTLSAYAYDAYSASGNVSPPLSVRFTIVDSRSSETSTKILALGDSITAAEGVSQGGYRGRLATRLRLLGYPVKFVGSISRDSGNEEDPPHEGWTGYAVRADESPGRPTEPQLYGAVTERALRNFTPDIILLMAGSNELCCSRSRPVETDIQDPETRAFVQSVSRDMDLLLRSIFEISPTTTVIVAGIPDSPAIPEDMVAFFNNGMDTPRGRLKGVKDIVTDYSQKGFDIHFIPDIEKLLPKQADYYSDELHPSSEGYERLADAWLSVLKDVLDDKK